MFVKKIIQKIASSDVLVSKSISRCDCCGKPVMGMSKIGCENAGTARSICPACMKLQNDDIAED